MNIIVAILIFGLLVLVHELGHFLAARKNGILVEEFAIGMGPKLVGFKRGDTLYSIRILPFGGFCKMLGEDEAVEDDERAFSNKSVWARIVVVVAGATFNIILAFIFSVILISSRGLITPVLDSITPDSPAAMAGLQVGDKIINVDNHMIVSYQEIGLYINQKKGDDVKIKYRRDGKVNTVVITPELTEDGRYIIGITGKYINKSNILQLLKHGFLEVLFWIKMVFLSLGMLVSGGVSTEDLAGPVRIVAIISEGYQESVKIGFTQLFQTISFYIVILSANLGVVNLLPIPALDGGRLVFLLLEAIRRKPIDREKESYVHFIGFVLLMILMVFMLFNDVRNIF